MKHTVTPERKLELLCLARRSRLQWILDAGANKYLSHSDDEEKLKRRIPAAECLQSILNFLTEVVNDGEIIGIESLAPHDCLDEDYDMNMPAPNYDPGVEPYAVFLEKLKHPNAIDIVKSLQQFVVVIENRSRERQNASILEYSSDGSFESTIADEIRTFLDKLHMAMRDNDLWGSETTSQWDKTMESSEKFIYTKLYDALFGANILDTERDDALHDRVQSLAFLSPEHLDMKSFQREWSLRFGGITADADRGTGGADTSADKDKKGVDSDTTHRRGGSRGEKDARVKEALEDMRGVDAAVNALRRMANARCPADKVYLEEEVCVLVCVLVWCLYRKLCMCICRLHLLCNIMVHMSICRWNV